MEVGWDSCASEKIILHDVLVTVSKKLTYE